MAQSLLAKLELDSYHDAIKNYLDKKKLVNFLYFWKIRMSQARSYDPKKIKSILALIISGTMRVLSIWVVETVFRIISGYWSLFEMLGCVGIDLDCQRLQRSASSRSMKKLQSRLLKQFSHFWDSRS